jgi:hypothetical protein
MGPRNGPGVRGEMDERTDPHSKERATCKGLPRQGEIREGVTEEEGTFLQEHFFLFFYFFGGV